MRSSGTLLAGVLATAVAGTVSIAVLQGAAIAQPASLQPGEIFADVLASGGEGPEMVVIPAGESQVGCLSNDDSCWGLDLPVMEIRITKPFALSIYEITYAQWDACVFAGGCNGYRPLNVGWGRGSRPVTNVGWQDARAYVVWLSRQTGKSYRLPSDTEWEYGARAGTVTKYFWGNEVGYNRANCWDCSSPWAGERTAPVGSFDPNAFGLFDMHGNVGEWVENCYSVRYTGPPSGAVGRFDASCLYANLRGGAWNDGPRSVRAASRGIQIIGRRDQSIGFRVARTLDP